MNNLFPTTLSRDLVAFMPELVLCGTIVLLLLVRLVPRFDQKHLASVSLVLTIYALYVSVVQWLGGAFDFGPAFDPRQWAFGTDRPISFELFGGLLVYDNFTIFLKLFLLLFAVLIIFLTAMTGIPDREDSADFYVLLLGATLGMMLMSGSNHLMMMFIGVEMASLPSYALAGFLKGKRRSSEAALKYVVYGGGAAGVMLYGMSLLAGKFGTGYLPDLAAFIAGSPADELPLILLGSLFILIGIGFKLAAVPFHFWCPDVFEGAAAEVAAFLSVASKGAALALMGRFVLSLGAWDTTVPYLVPVIAFFSALTATFGNLAAYSQNNLKRLLAYSTIAHAGYMMMGFALLNRIGAGAVLFYLVAYLFMNLGAFAIVAFLRNLTGSEDVRDFRGMIYRAPVLAVTLAVFLLSLLGLPPLAGFAAKFQIFQALYYGGQEFARTGNDTLAYSLYALLVIGGINTVISLFYYVRVLKIMILERPLEEVEGRPVAQYDVPSVPSIYVTALAAIVLVIGIFWDAIATASYDNGANRFPDRATPPVMRVAAGGRP